MDTHLNKYVIVELDGSGHRFWYVALLIDWLDENIIQPNICLVTTTVAQNRPEWNGFIAGDARAGRLDIVLTEDPRAAVRVIETLLQEQMATLVIPDGDRWLARLVMATVVKRLKPSGSMLIMRPYRAPGIPGAARHFAKWALMTTFSFLNRDFRVLKLAPSGWPVYDRRWVNDPVEYHPKQITRLAWYKLHGLGLDQKYLVVMGDLSHRKYVLELLDVFDAQIVENWHLVLVGKLGLQERNYFVENLIPTRVSLFEGFISNDDFDTWIAQADAVAVLYRNEGASGVLGKCAVAGVPVLVGGAQSVLESARLLDIPRSEISKVDSASIRRALMSLPPRRAIPTRQIIRVGSENFASRLIHD